MSDQGPILELVAELPLIDHHCHGVLTGTATGAEVELLATESDWPAPPGTSVFDNPFGITVRSVCAPLLDLPRHCTAEEYLQRRDELGGTEVSARLLASSGTERYLLDTGFRAGTIMTPDEMATLTGAATEEIVRLEALAESIAPSCTAAGFAGAFDDALEAAAAHAVGVKSIIAYRYGLDFDPAPPEPAQVTAAADRWLTAIEAGAPTHLADPVLLRHLLWRAVELRQPIQLHVGYGDPDIVLHRCDPSHLTAFAHATRTTGAQLMLLHCYPYIRQAGILAQLFPHVWLDTSCAVSHSGPSSQTLVRESLEMAPMHKLLYASDAFGLPELYACGSWLWRRAVGRVLDEWLADDLIGAADARRYVEMLGRDNAVRAYGLE
ncbi:amidohydrolase family protein [Kribbella speibonae]|uniref:Amidohydrolase n=1 Tax=Kribbella speibonae TaxID=1572660 RepID=A0A4R0IFM0_9ACTN|nr:amidohydrolase family protein [Kribbella speibonae]TCC30834.1 amidohydrolase [Kribbella speibonae]